MKVNKKVWEIVGINWLILVGLYSIGRLQEKSKYWFIPDELDPYYDWLNPLLFAIFLSSIYAVLFRRTPIKPLVTALILTFVSIVIVGILTLPFIKFEIF